MSEKKDESSLSSSSDEMKVEKEQASFADRMNEIVGPGRNAAAFGRKAGLSGAVILKYLDGRSDPSRARLIKIAEGAGVCVEWLATGQGPKYEADREAEAVRNEDQRGLDAIESMGAEPNGYLDPEAVLAEAEFVIRAFDSFRDSLTPQQAAEAVIERARAFMREKAKEASKRDTKSDMRA